MGSGSVDLFSSSDTGLAAVLVHAGEELRGTAVGEGVVKFIFRKTPRVMAIAKLYSEGQQHTDDCRGLIEKFRNLVATAKNLTR